MPEEVRADLVALTPHVHKRPHAAVDQFCGGETDVRLPREPTRWPVEHLLGLRQQAQSGHEEGEPTLHLLGGVEERADRALLGLTAAVH